MVKTEEGKFQEEVMNYLKEKRVLHWRMQAVSNLFGMPDIIGLYKGVFFGFELKSRKGKATLLQKRTMEAINNAGGVAFSVKDLQEIVSLFASIDIKQCVIDFETRNIFGGKLK